MKTIWLMLVAVIGLWSCASCAEEATCALQLDGPSVRGLPFGEREEAVQLTELGFRKLTRAEVLEEELVFAAGDVFKSDIAYVIFSEQGRLQMIYIPDAQRLCADGVPVATVAPEVFATLLGPSRDYYVSSLDVYTFTEGDIEVAAQHSEDGFVAVGFTHLGILREDMSPRITQPLAP